MMMSDVRIHTEQLGLSYPDAVALTGITLDIPAGERLMLLGDAGSGKTSLLKVLAGLIRPTQGRLAWDDEDPFAMSSEERRARQANLGMVFQSDALFDSLSVLDNVLFPLQKRGVIPAEALLRARDILARVGLEHAERDLPEQLSGGMRKRAGIARALVARPQVLLADDPLAGLDPDMAEQISQLLLENSVGTTLIVAASETLAGLNPDRLVRLTQGRLAFEEPARRRASGDRA